MGAALGAVAGIAFTCLVYHPGVMSPDSLDAYSEAISGTISGRAQSPIVPFIWMWVLKIWPSPFGILLFQNLLFWTGLATIAVACRRGPLRTAVSVLLIGLFPTVFGLLGMLWKDVLLAGALTAFVGMALVGAQKRSRLLLAASVLLLLCAASVRVNALPAVLPLATWLVVLWFETAGPLPAPRTVAAASVLLTLGLFVGSRLVDRAIVPPGAGSPLRAAKESMLLDLAGMSIRTGELHMPPYLLRAVPAMTLDGVRADYDPADANRFFYTTPWADDTLMNPTGDNLAELAGTWAKTIATRPTAYMIRRADVVLTIFQLRGVYYPFHIGIHPNSLGLEFNAGPLYRRVTWFLYGTRTVFFRGWIFVLVAALVVAVGVRQRRWSPVAVCASGLFYVSSYTIVSSGSDFRYIWWLVVATLIGLLLLCDNPGRLSAPRPGEGNS